MSAAVREADDRGALKGVHLTLVETRDTWNDICVGFTDAEFAQSYEWGEARRLEGWKPRRFVLSDDTTSIAAAQMLVKSRLGLEVIYCPRGPIWQRRNKTPAECVDSLTRMLDAVVEAHPVSAVVCDLHFDRGLLPGSALRTRGFRRISDGMTADIDLRADMAAQRSSFHRKWRNDLKKAQQAPLEVRRYEAPNYLDELYAMADDTAVRKGFIVGLNRTIAERFLRLRGGGTSAILAAVNPDGTAAAAALIVLFNEMASYLVGASVAKDDPAFSRGASNLVQWEALRWVKANGCTTYNLEGLDPEGNPGVYHFKQRMNGRLRLTRGMWIWTQNRLMTAVLRALLKRRKP